MPLLQVVSWWLLIQILGLAALPLAYRLFRWLPGSGYAFAKPLGLLLTSYLLWIGASLGFLRNTASGALVALLVTAGLSVAWYTRRRERSDPPLPTFLKDHWRHILAVELLFAVSFLAWAGLRAYAPDKIMSSGGEKFMEIAFLNAVLKSPAFPPHDPWLSGFAISYYYFGYVMMALLTRLSGVLPGIGFELYDALTFALTMTGAFGVVNSLVAGGSPTRVDDGQALRYGLLGSLFVAVMGNLEGLLEAFYARGLLPEAFWKWIDIPDLMSAGRVTGSWYPGDGWWWWRASRVIRDRNLLGEPMGLNPIDEFPFFSFLLGDNHPHVLALPFVLLSIALALNLLRREHPLGGGSAGSEDRPWWHPVASAFGGDWSPFFIYALALGSLGFLNTWDYPIYLGLAVLAYAVGRYTRTDESPLDLLLRAGAFGLGLTLVGVLLYLPFYISFSSQAGGIVPYLLPPTRLAQYLVMFGPFVFVSAVFLLVRILGARTSSTIWAAFARSWGVVVILPLTVLGLAIGIGALTQPGRQIVDGLLSDPRIQQVVGSAGPGAALKAIAMARLRDPWLFLCLSLLIAGSAVTVLRASGQGNDMPERGSSAQFSSLLLFCGLGLTYAVEFVYLRDSFGVRMNTIFKFYYQAWVMLGCASAFGTWYVMRSWRGRASTVGRRAFLAGVGFLTAAGLVYPALAAYSRVDGFEHQPNLNGTSKIARANPDDWAVVEWLRAKAEGTPVILEAPGKSYDYEGRISAFTGYPAVLGWALHESQWRGDYVEQGKREPDIAMIYTTEDAAEALALLRKWHVNYVVVGPPELRYVQALCSEPERPCNPGEGLEKFDQRLDKVFEQGQTALYRVPAE